MAKANNEIPFQLTSSKDMKPKISLNQKLFLPFILFLFTR